MDVKYLYKEFGKEYLKNELNKLSHKELKSIYYELNKVNISYDKDSLIKRIIDFVLDRFYVNIIPVGENNWRDNIFNNIIKTTLYHMQDYTKNFEEVCFTMDQWLKREDKDIFHKMQRIYDEAGFTEKTLGNEPKFFPNEHVKISDTAFFRMTLNCIVTKDCSRYDKLVETPWVEEKLPYLAAMWLSICKTIKDHSNYNLIICNNKDEYEDELEKIIDLCKAHDKEYKIVTDEPLNFEDLLELFNFKRVP